MADQKIIVRAGERVEMVVPLLGTAETRYVFELTGEGAEVDFKALILAGEGEKCTLRVETYHRVPGCVSRTLVKSVARGEVAFEGVVYVAEDAQQTDARQQSKGLLLGDGRIDFKPQLEIYADDVQCSHGATVGQLDAEALLYMRQRGIPESAARRLQLEGFVAEIVQGDEEVMKKLCSI